MSIVKIKDRTTASQEEFDNLSQSSDSLLFTTAAPERLEEFSIELTLGAGWNDSYSPDNIKLIATGDGITIQRHGSIVVEVAEEVRVPHNRYGILLPTGSLFLSRGVIVTPAKVEPAFVGRLKLRLFNTVNRNVYLEKGAKLGSVVFFSTESTKVHPAKYRSSEISKSPQSRIGSLRRSLSANKSLLISGLFSIGSAILAFLLVYLFYYRPSLERQERMMEQARTNRGIQHADSTISGVPRK